MALVFELEVEPKRPELATLEAEAALVLEPPPLLEPPADALTWVI